jgi:RHS repeat-associated protein
VRALLSAVCATLVAAALYGQSTWTLDPYEYDKLGNITKIGADTFVYDQAGRVTSGSAGPGRRQDYTYDGFGNLLTITTDGNVGAQRKLAVAPATNRLDAAGVFNVFGTYNGAGFMTSFLAADTYTYDGTGMMTSSRVDGVEKTYVYDANDERIGVLTTSGAAAGEKTWTLRDPSGKVLRTVLQHANGTWSWQQDYIYRGANLLSAAVNTRHKTLHFHLDHLGTPRLITGNGGVEISRHTYYPFGEEATSPGQDAEVMKFTGHERDAASLDYMHARYYGPRAGRFLSVDPVLNLKRALREPQNWNRYAYVMNNPLKYTDPTGKDVSIRLSFRGDGWTDEEKKKIITQVTSWYQKQNVGKVFVFDGAKARHGGNFPSRMFSGGYTSINVSSGSGTKHTPTTVFAGNYSGLSAAQRINAISNSIIHETVAHHFGATAGNNADQMFFARDSGYRMWDSVRQRYGTVADSYSYADPATRGNVTNGPIPIHPEDAKKLQRELKDEHVEPPDYDP